MSKYSRNELYINQLENELISLNKLVDILVAENYELKQNLERLKSETIAIPDFDYHNREYKENNK